MARLARLVVPGLPIHLMMSGHNRQSIFFTDEERRFYLESLRDAAREYELAIHAYVLMPMQVHVLATPSHQQSVSRVMQSVGRRYAQLFNQKHQRTGTLWDGRFKSCVVDPQTYFLQIQRYIEQSPIRAGLVQNLKDWSWSSFAHHVGAETIPWIVDHEIFWSLGNTPFERQHAWQDMASDPMSNNEIEKVSNHLNYGWPIGSPQFLTQLAHQTNRPVIARKPGRPQKQLPK